MATRQETADSVFRDYEVDGVPTSGPHNPSKAEIRDYEEMVNSDLDRALIALASSATGVLSRSLSSPPASPVSGDRYIVAGPTPTGAWAGQTNKIAQWDGAAWAFTAPANVSAIFVQDESVLIAWNVISSSWVVTTGDAIVVAAWTTLSGISGTRPGQRAMVRGDGGQHTDPVMPGSVIVDNSGEYSWSVSPAGWRRVGDLIEPATVTATQKVVRQSVGSAASDLSTFSIGSTTPDTGNAATTSYWGRAERVLRDGYLASASIRVDSAGAGYFVVVDSSGVILSETPAAAPSAGVNNYTFSGVYMPAGSWLIWRPTSGANMRYDATGQIASVSPTGYPGVGGRVSVGVVTNVSPAMQFTVEYAAADMVSKVASGASARANGLAFGADIRTGQPSTFTWAPGTPSIRRLAAGYDVGQDILAGDVITGAAVELVAPSGVDHFIVQLYSRSTASGSIESAPPITGDVLIQTVRATPAELGLTVGATDAALARVAFRPFTAVAGQTYFVVFAAYNSSFALVDVGLGANAGTDSRQRRRGYYTPTATSYLNIGAGFMTSACLLTQRRPPAALRSAASIDRFDDAGYSVSSFDLSTVAVVGRNGNPFQIGDKRTLSAAASGKVRYDTVYFDPELRVFGVASGTEATGDAAERQAVLSSPKYLPIWNARVTDTGISDVVPMWRISRSGDPFDLLDFLEDERRRSRSCLKKTLAKVRKGAALKIGVVGDSIAAMQYGTIAEDRTSPNGPNRDRAVQGYLAGVIGSDILSTIPLYTAVGLGVGRADDGAGSVHTKVGWLWELVAALQATGQTVYYDNFAVGGYATSHAMSGSVVGAWITNAIALGWDTAFLHFGMNELGNTTTESNLVTIANAFLAAGIEVVMMGVPRRNNQNAAFTANWEYTNRAIARAAKYTGSAHVPTMALLDERYLGTVGISKLDTATANQFNHPGIVEHRRIGAELNKLFF